MTNSTRKFKIAAVQLGAIQKADSKEKTVTRLCEHLKAAATEGAKLAIFPELCLTSFFPRWFIASQEEVDSYFEAGDISQGVAKPLFELAKQLGIGFHLGYAELTDEGKHFNTSVLVDDKGIVVAKYRKAHLPGFVEPVEGAEFQQLEKRYFLYGDTGFKATRTDPSWIDSITGILICNDRRWPEAWREYALQGMELCVLGFNTASNGKDLFGDEEGKDLRVYHSNLSTKANCYFNSCFGVAVAKCGVEDDQELIGGTIIVSPNGIIIAEAKQDLLDEIVYADIDLDDTINNKKKMFDFDRHRRPELYGRHVSQKGAVLPE